MALMRPHLTRLSALALSLSAVLMTGPVLPLPIAGAESTGGHIFLESYGRCSWHPHSGQDAQVCATTKFGNVYAGDFAPRKVTWGTAYSFNCGPKSRWVRMGVILPDGDGGFPDTVVWRHAKRGSGFRMDTQANMEGQHNLPVWFGVEAVVLRTTCAWHIVSVEGTPEQVKAEIPPIPPLYRVGSGDKPVNPPVEEDPQGP